MDAREILKTNALFEKFGDNGVALLATICEVRQYPADTPIFVANMMGESMFIIAQGTVTLTMGDSAHLSLGPGDHFGQLALLQPGPRLVSAQAATAVALLEMPRRRFLKLQSLKPQACVKLLMAICRDYAESARQSAGILGKLLG